RSAPGLPQLIHLRSTRVRAEDGQWAQVQKMTDAQEQQGNPASQMTMFKEIIHRSPAASLHATGLDVGEREVPTNNININHNNLLPPFREGDQSLSWLQNQLGRF